MPAWVANALRMIAAGGLFSTGAAIAERQVGLPVPFQGPVTGPGFQIIDGITVRRTRRRRRRALTASDRADIAFIAGVLSKSAAEKVAAIIAART